MRFGSFTPIFPSRSASSGLLITSRARICPFKQRSAAAVSTPSGAPPVPITACTPAPTTAAEIPAERSPSPISRIRAPAARMSSINFSCRTRSSTTTTKSSTSRSSRFAIDFRLSATGTSRSIAPLQSGALAGGEHGDGVRGPCRAQVRALEWIHGDVHLRKQGLRRVRRETYFFADIQHGRLIALALADDDGPVDLHRIHRLAHGFDRHFIRFVAVAKSHRACRRDRGILDHAQKIQAELFFHNFFSALPVPGFTVLHGLPLTLQGGAYHRPKGLAPSISLAGHAALQVLERYHLRFLDPPL